MAEEKQPQEGPITAHNEPISSDVLAAEARHAADAEHQMTLWQAVKTYPNAIGWSVLLSSTLIMEGYDLALLGNLYASPVFNEKYGTWLEDDQKYAVSAAWQSGLSNGARAGEIIGLIIAGWFTDRYGAKKTTVGFLFMMIATIFVLFFAPNVGVLVAGEVLCG
jgi:SP family general alpha glucoside:H+ symporter-like MFS transporter